VKINTEREGEFSPCERVVMRTTKNTNAGDTL
jgi:hypothetical protein